MMRLHRVVVCCLLLSGCATPYQQTGFQGGYSTSTVSEDIFEISFDGNTTLDSNALDESLLRKAAEVTRLHGFTYFIVVDRERQASAGFVFKPGMLGPTHQTARSITIQCYAEDPERTNAINAEQFLQRQGHDSSKPERPIL